MGSDEKTLSKVMEDAVKYAQDGGVVIVAAAGNSGSNHKQYSAQDKDVVSVRSLDGYSGSISSFANWGDWVDVAAPAGRVLGPVPDGGYAWWAGTSMAAPQVAGQIALLRSERPGLSSKDQTDAVTKSARKLRSKSVKFGAIDLPASLDFVDRGKVK